MTTPDKPAPRSIETSIEIDAPVEAVWKALTDGEELTRWFPLEARVKPGKGGSVWTSWRGEHTFDSPIDAWEPNRHLRLVYAEATTDPNAPFQIPYRVCVDYHLESKGGKTVLRLVHSGFSKDAMWDGLYDGTMRGWSFQLRGLKHYLEQHRGTPRQVVYTRFTSSTMSLTDLWEWTSGPSGFGRPKRLDSYQPGDRYRIDLGDGVGLEGTVIQMRPKGDLVGTVESHNNGLLRVQTDDLWGKRDLYFTLALFGVPKAECDRIHERADAIVAPLRAQASGSGRTH